MANEELSKLISAFRKKRCEETYNSIFYSDLWKETDDLLHYPSGELIGKIIKEYAYSLEPDISTLIYGPSNLDWEFSKRNIEKKPYIYLSEALEFIAYGGAISPGIYRDDIYKFLIWEKNKMDYGFGDLLFFGSLFHIFDLNKPLNQEIDDDNENLWESFSLAEFKFLEQAQSGKIEIYGINASAPHEGHKILNKELFFLPSMVAGITSSIKFDAKWTSILGDILEKDTLRYEWIDCWVKFDDIKKIWSKPIYDISKILNHKANINIKHTKDLSADERKRAAINELINGAKLSNFRTRDYARKNFPERYGFKTKQIENIVKDANHASGRKPGRPPKMK